MRRMLSLCLADTTWLGNQLSFESRWSIGKSGLRIVHSCGRIWRLGRFHELSNSHLIWPSCLGGRCSSDKKRVLTTATIQHPPNVPHCKGLAPDWTGKHRIIGYGVWSLVPIKAWKPVMKINIYWPNLTLNLTTKKWTQWERMYCQTLQRSRLQW